MRKTVLITGASSGLGYEFVKLFSKDNYDLILVARNVKRLEEIKNQFPNINIMLFPKDLTKPNAVKELYHEIKAENLNIDVLINNAGFGLLGKFDELDIDKEIDMINLNVSALTELTYYVLKEMKKRNEGRILNVASIAAFAPGPLMAVYHATKAYVLSFSEALAEDLKETGIAITILCPGPTTTNFAKVAASDNTRMFNNAMDAETVAKSGYNALMRNKRVIVTGAVNKTAVFFTRFFPRSLTAKVAKYVSQYK